MLGNSSCSVKASSASKYQLCLTSGRANNARPSASFVVVFLIYQLADLRKNSWLNRLECFCFKRRISLMKMQTPQFLVLAKKQTVGIDLRFCFSIVKQGRMSSIFLLLSSLEQDFVIGYCKFGQNEVVVGGQNRIPSAWILRS